MKCFIATALATATALLCVAAAIATPPGENGRIAYRLWLDAKQTHGAIFTIRPNGTERRRITHPAPGVAHVVPDWSTYGHWIAYVRVHKDYGFPRRSHPTGPRSSRAARRASVGRQTSS
jgi:hypothetical protein